MNQTDMNLENQNITSRENNLHPESSVCLPVMPQPNVVGTDESEAENEDNTEFTFRPPTILSDSPETFELKLSASNALYTEYSISVPAMLPTSSLASEESGYSENINTPEDLLENENITWPGYFMRQPDLPQPSALARQVASKVIKHVRDIKYENEHLMRCPDCTFFPVLPVTGPCGHTRCNMCIKKNGVCPCGTRPPENLFTNILIQDLVEKMLPGQVSSTNTNISLRVSAISHLEPTPSTSKRASPLSDPSLIHLSFQQQLGSFRLSKHKIQYKKTCARLNAEVRRESSLGPDRLRRQFRLLRHSPLSAADRISPQLVYDLHSQGRYNYARQLLALRKYGEAAPHLALVAATSEPVARNARLLLSKVISKISGKQDPRRLVVDLYRSVRAQSLPTWLQQRDLECIICTEVMDRPVTTPCGHTFCRGCIEENFNYRSQCALCSHSLETFNVYQTPNTIFVSAALAAMSPLMPAAPTEPQYIPIVPCTVAFPEIACPLLILNPRYWPIIRQLLECGSKQFGIISMEGYSYASFGTLVEVRDCVQFEDCSSILSTVGLSRFVVLKRVISNGCHMAQVEEIKDVIPTSALKIQELQLMAQQISVQTLSWLSGLDPVVLANMEGAFGRFPDHRLEELWWEKPDGPRWLWWLIAVSSLKSEKQVLMLLTKHLIKRMMGMAETLEVMLTLNIAPLFPGVNTELYLD